jgi:hypothetical protein
MTLPLLTVPCTTVAKAEDAAAAPPAAAPAPAPEAGAAPAAVPPAAAPPVVAAPEAPVAAGPKTVIVTATDIDAPSVSAPGTPSEIAKKAYAFLMPALESGKFEKFIDLGDDRFKAAMKDPPFDQLIAIYAPRLKKGYDAVYFGDFKKIGARVYLWKLTLKDGGDDIIVQVSIKADKIHDFFLL